MEIGEKSHGNVLDLFRLEGRRALITGGGKGLGQVIARALAEAGADVAVTSRTLAECESTAHEIVTLTGRRAFAYVTDVTQATALERLAASVEKILAL